MFIDTTDTVIKTVMTTEHFTRILRNCSQQISSSDSYPWRRSNPLSHSQMYNAVPPPLSLSIIRSLPRHMQHVLSLVSPRLSVRLSYVALPRFSILLHSPRQRYLCLSLESARRFYEVTDLEGCQAGRSYCVLLHYIKCDPSIIGVPGGSTPQIPKALQNRAKLNPIVKTVKNFWIWDTNTPRCSEKMQ